MSNGVVVTATRRRSDGGPSARSLLISVLGQWVGPSDTPVWNATLISALDALGILAGAFVAFALVVEGAVVRGGLRVLRALRGFVCAAVGEQAADGRDERRRDGGVVLEIDRAWDAEMLPQLLSLGEHVEVLEPADVREQLAEAATRIAARHAAPARRARSVAHAK